jgi:hypothetical protein
MLSILTETFVEEVSPVSTALSLAAELSRDQPAGWPLLAAAAAAIAAEAADMVDTVSPQAVRTPPEVSLDDRSITVAGTGTSCISSDVTALDTLVRPLARPSSARVWRELVLGLAIVARMWLRGGRVLRAGGSGRRDPRACDGIRVAGPDASVGCLIGALVGVTVRLAVTAGLAQCTAVRSWYAIEQALGSAWSAVPHRDQCPDPIGAGGGSGLPIRLRDEYR